MYLYLTTSAVSTRCCITSHHTGNSSSHGNGHSSSNGNSSGTSIDWEAVHGLMEDAIYGGRIDNAFDLRVLRSYLRYDTIRYATLRQRGIEGRHSLFCTPL